MKITFVSPRSNLSGGLRVIATHARMLQARGHTVTIVTPAKPEFPWKTRLKSALRGRIRRPAEPAGHFASIPVSVHTAQRPDFQLAPQDLPDADILIATWWETAFAVAAMPPEKGRKCYLIQGHEVFPPLPWQISRASYYLPLKPIVIASWLDQVLRQEYGRTDAALVPNGTDLSQFNSPIRGKSPHPTIGFLYSINPIKGTATILQAIGDLRTHLPDLRVMAFGTEAVSTDLPLPPGSTYHQRPAQDIIPRIYAACDVFLGGSTSEGFFLPLLEAMACRTPVVSTRVGAAQDLIQEGKTGHIVDVGDAAALSQAAHRILTLTPDAWQQMSENCHALAQNHGWDQAADRMEKVLDALVTEDVG